LITVSICIVPIEFPDNSVIRLLAQELAAVFKRRVEIHRSSVDVTLAFDPFRQQYYSSALLKQLIDNPACQSNCKVLGVVNFDLFIPIFSYVFGEAQLEGRGAVVSNYRLSNQFFGAKPDPHLLLQRLVKEAVHELGHTYGLAHCQYPGCVMTFSTSVEDIDDKNGRFCQSCADFLHRKKSAEFIEPIRAIAK